MPPPTCNNPTSQALVMAVDSACSNRLPSLKFVGDTLLISTLIGLVTLTFDLFTSNSQEHVRLYYCRKYVVNLSTNFSVSGAFRRFSANPCHGLRDLATLTSNGLTSEVMAFIGDSGIRVPSVNQV